MKLIVVLCLIAGIAVATETNAPSPFAKGLIEKVEPSDNRLTIKTEQGPRAYQWTERTYIFRGKERITPAQLQPGELIALRIYAGPNGELLIRRIKAYPPPEPTTAKSP